MFKCRYAGKFQLPNLDLQSPSGDGGFYGAAVRRISPAAFRAVTFHLTHVIHLTDDRRSSVIFAGLAIDRTKDRGHWTKAVKEASVYSVAKCSNFQTLKLSNTQTPSLFSGRGCGIM